MSRSLLLAIAQRRQGRVPGERVSIGAILSELGDRSFGWAILFFALVNMLPMPYGATLVTALPLILLTGQMVLGFTHVRLPGFISRRTVPSAGFRRVVIRLKPFIRPIEKIIRPRQTWLFLPRSERMIGLLLLFVSIALFIPIPLSGWIPAAALFISGFGLIERDGLVTLLGLALGVTSIVVTAVVLLVLERGAEAFF